MFNGVGLRTPRGSGTNGYVQRSLATLPAKKIVKLSNQSDSITRPKSRTDPSILLHEKKREIELKLLQLRTTLQGSMTDQEIDDEIRKQREFMLKNLNTVPLDATRNEHIMAQLKKAQLDNLQEVLRISIESNNGRPVVERPVSTSNNEYDDIKAPANSPLIPNSSRTSSVSSRSSASSVSDPSSVSRSEASGHSSVSRSSSHDPRKRKYLSDSSYSDRSRSGTVSRGRSSVSSIYSSRSRSRSRGRSHKKSTRRSHGRRNRRRRSPSVSSYSSRSRSHSRSYRRRR